MAGLLLFPDFEGLVQAGAIGAWRVREGDAVTAGQTIAELVVDKVALEIGAPRDGIVLALLADAGEGVAAGTAIAAFGDPGESFSPPPKPPPPAAPEPILAAAACGLPERSGPMRAAIARRMAVSKAAAPHFYVTTAVDMTAALELRKRLKREGVRASVNDMLIRAAGLALRRWPRVAALHAPGGEVRRDRMHVGFACALDDDGLVVPVVRDADRLRLAEIAEAAKGLADRARGRRLAPPDYLGGVFTVSNLGTFEVDEFSAIINPGESAILAVGKIVETPVAGRDGAVSVAPILRMTLSSDHRVIDGVLAARFNGSLKDLLEKPEQLL